MNIRAISVNVGKALLVSALFMLLSIIISVLNGMDSAFTPLLLSFIITLLVGSFPFIFVRKSPALTMKDGFLTIIIAWILSFVFGMLPYVLWGGEFTLVNAWFESVSGYTTTGSTILNDIEALPKSLLFWRSSTHYIGGLGVVVFLLLVIPEASPYRLKLTNMEMSSLSKEGYRYKSTKVVQVITVVYLGLTLVSTLLLWAAGMPLFDAVNHAFSIAATGGFSTKNLSIGYFQSDLINAIAMVFMALAAMHFGLIYAVFATRSLKPLNNTVVKYYIGSIAVMSLIIMFSLMSDGGYDSWGKAWIDASFNVVSYMSTTGFATCDNSSWPYLAGVILMMAGIQCGCSGSTTGGLKVDRIIISFKAISTEIRRRLHPSSVSQVRMSGHHLPDSAVSSVFLYIVVYVMVIFVSVLAVILCGSEPVEAISGVISSVGSVGPGLGGVASLENYSMQPEMSKLIFSFDMFLGRLEIFPVFIAISMIFKREK
ncbi:MAG: TrkH family potassium uptake protein [Bacteroidales bacterium]|nr:TrkH family potassium uptake protein [Bacteroidales bacterium]MBQ9723327.1 TrkH family potassium uptake protein [Bacteroidales bacterium]